MKYYVKNLFILLLSLCLIVLVYPPTRVHIFIYVESIVSEARPPIDDAVVFVAVCDGEPEFSPALATTTIGYGGTHFYTEYLPYEHTIAWIKPNCSVVLVMLTDIPDIIKPFTGLGPEASGLTAAPSPHGFRFASFRNKIRNRLSFADILAGGERYGVYYYTDIDLSGDFTAEERVSSYGFLPEHINWVVSKNYLDNDGYNHGFIGASKYPESGGLYIKLANMLSGPFQGQSLYVISILIPDQNNEK